MIEDHASTSQTTGKTPRRIPLLWTPYLYGYLVCEIVLALLISVLLRSQVLLFALDAALFFPIFAAHIHRDEIARLFRVASFWGVVKSLTFIAAILLTGDMLDGIVDQGPAYHADTLNWILYNEGTIAHPREFLPLHLLGVWRVVVSTMGSCGLTTLIGGARELNIMNFHVAQLLQMSAHPWRTIWLAWPTWSLLRGWAYLALMVASARTFLVIVRQRPWRWSDIRPYLLWGLAGCAVDAGLKGLFAPLWRVLLSQSLG